jgi:hypothetical protein
MRTMGSIEIYSFDEAFRDPSIVVLDKRAARS